MRFFCLSKDLYAKVTHVRYFTIHWPQKKKNIRIFCFSLRNTHFTLWTYFLVNMLMLWLCSIVNMSMLWLCSIKKILDFPYLSLNLARSVILKIFWYLICLNIIFIAKEVIWLVNINHKWLLLHGYNEGCA